MTVVMSFKEMKGKGINIQNLQWKAVNQEKNYRQSFKTKIKGENA